jgi:transposase
VEWIFKLQFGQISELIMGTGKQKTTRYTDSFKRSVVAKLTIPGAPSVYTMREKLGVSGSTLYKWIQVYGNNQIMTDKKRTPSSRSPEEKFQAILDTTKLSEQELGKYLRTHGLHSADLEKWQTEFKASLTSQQTQKKIRNPELKVMKAENKALKRELNRKDKALAEAAALIILKKKADILFGEAEADE